MEAAIVEAVGLVSSAIGIVEFTKKIAESQRLKASKKERLEELIVQLRNATKELEGRSMNPNSDPHDFMTATTTVKRCLNELEPLVSGIKVKVLVEQQETREETSWKDQRAAPDIDWRKLERGAPDVLPDSRRETTEEPKESEELEWSEWSERNSQLIRNDIEILRDVLEHNNPTNRIRTLQDALHETVEDLDNEATEVLKVLR